MTKKERFSLIPKPTEKTRQPIEERKSDRAGNRLSGALFFQVSRRVILSSALAAFLLAGCSSRASEAVAEQPPPATKLEQAQENTAPATTPAPLAADSSKPPEAYRKNCAECHGAKGEGTKKSPELFGVTTRAEDAYSDEDLLNIINDAKGFGLSAKMPSFRDKMTEAEKQQIIMWLKALN